MIEYNGNVEFGFKCNEVFHLGMDWRCNWKLVRKWLNAMELECLKLNVMSDWIVLKVVKCFMRNECEIV